ncbi:CHC2 zinc finger domain-containing protein [Xanthomonas hortorum pv. gardneri]|uniref:CHC2 zinc finger domain-containing protein n=1 Tax=Xanthomonas hortorum TaxID=56454 RepID=UPI001E628FAB|nr:CHC2 zinc finger domain-containing protein [Xanthomonas hortorum]MCC8495416.1 CHC2 zinc finger domain-containing protein [Xanthomonas hortorum pv. gardneri]MCE4527778.1 CHC2 zinc finger domain-containing protein [Xanthomonas hortorum pv. vitians]
MTQKRQRPGGYRGAVQSMSQLYGHSASASRPRERARLQENWRDRLPDPGSYYARQIAKLGNAHGNGWAQGQCPFHEDRNASFSVNLSSARGPWKCFAGCGSGDLVSFHMRLTGLDFKEASRELVGVRA